MKRRISVTIVAGLAASSLALSACSRSDGGVAGPAGAEKASPWVRPPMIDGVMRDGPVLIVRGAADPNARVVLRAADVAAVAVNADAAGRFELRLPPLQGDVRLTPEVQVGEDAAISPETLVVIQGGAGPVALIAAGQPTVRLDGSGVLNAVDSDGSTLVVSGPAGPKAPIVTIGGAEANAAPAPQGQWRAMVGRAGGVAITVDGQTFDYPGDAGNGGFTISRAGQGWRIVWHVAPGGHQSAWLPDRAGR
ncbi:hypothetical protein [Brevundimonas sp.]|uniref:hypothetical protein n=1 Tax=Brevundimonas sp. TaxID=1871086 RepID=UPI00289EB45B|nr:hypothetical protein [Brevundimonas sp.]